MMPQEVIVTKSLAQLDPQELHLFQEVFEVVDMKRIVKGQIVGLKVGGDLLGRKSVKVEVASYASLGWITNAHFPDLRYVFTDFNHAKATLLAAVQADLALIERIEQPA